MSTNTVSVSPCGVGAISSGLGLGAGYILAPRKFSLERLSWKKPDRAQFYASGSAILIDKWTLLGIS